MSKKTLLIRTFEKAGFVNQHDAAEDAVWHGSQNNDHGYVTTRGTWQLNLREGQEIIDGDTITELRDQLDESYRPSRANNPRITEIESQIDKLAEELMALVQPRTEELDEINQYFSDMISDQVAENLGPYEICIHVLDQREEDQ